MEVFEHVLHRLQHQLLFGDDRGIEVAITATARLLFDQKTLRHEISDRGRDGADVAMRQSALDFHSGTTTKLPEGIYDLVFARAEYLEEAFGCHTLHCIFHSTTAPLMPQAPASSPKIAETNHSSPKISPINR